MSELLSPSPRLLMSLLSTKTYHVAHRRLAVCHLWLLRPTKPSADVRPAYAIGMKSGRKWYLYCAGSDKVAAFALYKRITKGRLEPIHLNGVMEDFFWEQEHRELCGSTENS